MTGRPSPVSTVLISGFSFLSFPVCVCVCRRCSFRLAFPWRVLLVTLSTRKRTVAPCLIPPLTPHFARRHRLVYILSRGARGATRVCGLSPDATVRFECNTENVAHSFCCWKCGRSQPHAGETPTATRPARVAFDFDLWELVCTQCSSQVHTAVELRPGQVRKARDLMLSPRVMRVVNSPNSAYDRVD